MRKVRIEPSVGGLKNLTGSLREFLPDEVAVQGALLLQQGENEHFDMPLYHLTVQTLFHAVNISLSDISTSTHDGEGAEAFFPRGLECLVPGYFQTDGQRPEDGGQSVGGVSCDFSSNRGPGGGA